MPRSVTTFIALLGLVAATYLIFAHEAGVSETGFVDRGVDGPLFGLAIGVVSVLLLATGLTRPARDPSASDSLTLT